MSIDPPLPLDPPAYEAMADPVEAAHPAPRIRWAGIVWGSAFAILAATALFWLVEASRRTAIQEWLLTLTPASFSPGAVVAVVVIGIGVLLLTIGVVALLRRAQVRTTTES